MERFINIALIMTSVTLIISVILQSKGAGLGGLTSADFWRRVHGPPRDRAHAVLGNHCSKRDFLCAGDRICIDYPLMNFD